MVVLEFHISGVFNCNAACCINIHVNTCAKHVKPYTGLSNHACNKEYALDQSDCYGNSWTVEEMM